MPLGNSLAWTTKHRPDLRRNAARRPNFGRKEAETDSGKGFLLRRCVEETCERIQGAGRTVYHFVYHGGREGRLSDAVTLFEQKQNPLI